MKPVYTDFALQIFKDFLTASAKISHIRVYFVQFSERINFCQVQMKKAIKAKKTQRSILLNCWKDETFKLVVNYKRKKTTECVEFAKKIVAINDKVRDEVLDSYLQTCSLKHSIEFFKW